jgi:tol-pal system protein YbgF
MKRILSIGAICALVALVPMSRPTPVYAVSKEIVQLQQMVQTLSDQVRDLQKAFLEKNAVMAELVEKSADNTNRLQAAIDSLQKTLQSSLGSQVTSTNQRLDSQQQRLQLINDSVDELKSRQNKLSEQLTQIRTLLETVQAPPAAAPVQQQVIPQPPPGPPPAPDLYKKASGDLINGDTKQAMAEFQDYLKYYPDGDRAENCNFFIGEIYYTNGDFQRAIDYYHDVIDRYPEGNKTAAAYLKLGFALLELRQKTDAAKELHLLIKKFPHSDEAKRAQDRLKGLGLPIR